MEKLAVSVIILKGPEQEKTAGLLKMVFKSVQWSTQIIVVDSHSNIDWSPYRAEFSQLEVVQLQTQPTSSVDFAVLRNRSTKYATQPWILWLDSDEVVQPINLATLQLVLKSASDVTGMTVTRSDVFWNRTLQFGEAGNQHLTRLMRTNKGKWQGAVHEQLVVHGRVVASGITLQHYSHASLTQFITIIMKYAKIASRQKHQSFWPNLIELLLFPLGKFVWNYIVRLGCLDGWAGLAYAFLMSLHSLLVRIYRYEQLQEPIHST